MSGQPVPTPAWFAGPGSPAPGPAWDLLERTGREASPLWSSALMEDPQAAESAEEGLPEMPEEWFTDRNNVRPDPLMAWWQGRRAQQRDFHLHALSRFHLALSGGFRHWRLARHVLFSARMLGFHGLVAACAGILSRRAPDLPELRLVSERLGWTGNPQPPLDPDVWSPDNPPPCEHRLLQALGGWRGVEGIRVAFVVGAHRFDEKDMLFGIFPDLKRVVLFEANPDLVGELRNLHGRDPRITIVPCALGAQSGEAVFHLSSNDGLSSSLLPFGTHAENCPEVTFVRDIRVPCRTLPDAMAEYGLPAPELLFLDVQGAEYGILSAIPAGTLGTIRVLFTEASLEEIYRGGRTLAELEVLLGEFFLLAGYSPISGHHGAHGNALFLRKIHGEELPASGPSPLAAPRGEAPAGSGPLLDDAESEALRRALQKPLFAGLLERLAPGLHAPERGVLIWGAGVYGRNLLPLLRDLGLSVGGFVDSDPARRGEILLDLPVLSPADLPDRNPRPFVVIGSMYHAEIAERLRAMGFEPGQDFHAATGLF